jgi:hypothetical protein
MNEQKITTGMLINAETILNEKIEGFNMKDVENALLKLTGVDTFIDLYKIIAGTAESGDVANVITNSGLAATEQWAKDVATKQVVGKFGVGMVKSVTKTTYRLLFLLPDLTEIGVEAWAKYESNKEKIALALEKKGMLDTFYAECNKRIAEAAGDDGEWLIRFDKTKAKTKHSFTMWGIPNLLADWKLSGELVRQVTGAGDDFIGTYEGILTLEIEGVEMDVRFDKHFIDIDRIYAREKTSWGLVGVSKVKDDYKTTILKRTVSGNITATVAGSGEFTVPLQGSLTAASDKTEFVFDHHIHGEGNFMGGATTRSLKYTSGNVGSYSYVLEGFQISPDLIISGHNYGGKSPSEFNGETAVIDMNINTVWKPLESEPKLTIFMK